MSTSIIPSKDAKNIAPLVAKANALTAGPAKTQAEKDVFVALKKLFFKVTLDNVYQYVDVQDSIEINSFVNFTELTSLRRISLDSVFRIPQVNQTQITSI